VAVAAAPPPAAAAPAPARRRRRHPDAADEQDPPPPQAFLERYSLGELLGRGASASVRVAIDHRTGGLAAVKLLARRRGRRDRSAALAAEVAACRALQPARHAARLHAVFEGADAVAIVTELLPGGDLSDVLAHAPEGRLGEREAAAAARRALEFVADAHALGFVVGDVKPQNFALRRLYPCARHLADPAAHPDKGPLDVAAIDFGCCVDYGALLAARGGGGGGGGGAAAAAAALSSPSSTVSSSSSLDEDGVCVVLPTMGAAGGACSSSSSSSSSGSSSSGASSPSASPPASPSASRLPSSPPSSSSSPQVSGTPVYMSPEVLKGCASPSSDVWACGVMLYELLTGQFPFWREPPAEFAALGARAVTEAIAHGPVLFPRDPFAAGGGGAPPLKASVQDLLLGMLRRDPARRLTAAEALEHPWFAEVLGTSR
jgi:serine/threonine protein kinase